MKKFRYSNILTKSAGVIILTALLSRLNIKEILCQLSQINLGYYISGLILFIPILVFKSIRWGYLLEKQAIHISKNESMRFYASGMFIGAVTPGRVGEIIRVLYIKNKGYSAAKALFSVFVDRLVDILFLICIGYIGVVFFLSVFAKHIGIISLVFFTIIAFIVICVLIRGKLKGLLAWLIHYLLPVKNKESIMANMQIFMESFKNVGFKSWTFVILITLASWFCYYLEMFIFAKALRLDISLLYISAIVSTTALIALIPITIAGIGTRDAALVLLFSQVGLPKESAIAFSGLVLLMMVINTCICSVGWFLNKQEKIENIAQSQLE